MPDHKEQDNTQQQLFVDSPLSHEAKSSDPKAFVAHLREEIRQATRMVMEEIMSEELTHFVGAEWGESSPTRTGYRNGYYTRDLQTTSGRIEDLQVPRDRDGAFHTQMFERYNRYEPNIAEGLTEMFVSGTSTEKVGNVAKTLLGITPSSSTISRLNHSLAEQYEAWRKRALQAHYRVLYLDGVYFTVRHGEKTDSTVLLTALGVDLDGKREVLALRTGAEESKDGWGCLLNDLRTRGVQNIDLIVTDGHEGILAALREQFPAAPRQRCVIHKQRNVMNAIPKRGQADVSAELSAIWKQETKEEALLNLQAFQAKYHKRYPEAVRSLMEDGEHLLTFYDFPAVMHRYIRTTNAIESLFSNVRQRTDSIDTFTTETSCVCLVWAVMQDIHLQRIPVK
jgi:transposase-like protein